MNTGCCRMMLIVSQGYHVMPADGAELEVHNQKNQEGDERFKDWCSYVSPLYKLW
jgi:hypothetical protein